MNNEIKQQLEALPTKPGVYQLKNDRGEVLYVGKAKSLRTRVRSYFRAKADLDPAKQEMVKQVVDIETIVVDSENEALILEATLIRKYQPPHNVVLRDDKYYLFIKITKEELPRIYPVRRIQQDKARYFGPYSSASSVRRTLKLLRRIFPYREEKESPREKVFPHPLFSAADNGDAVSTQEYQHNIGQIIRFLKGERAEIITTLRRGMREASADKKYERAAIWRDQLQAIERLEGNQKVFLATKESFDVVSIATDPTSPRLRGAGGPSAANVFQVRDGKLLGKQTFLLRHKGSAHEGDILRQFLLQYYRDAQDIPKLIFVPNVLTDASLIATYINKGAPPTFAKPARGKKKQLLDMGLLNAEQLLQSERAEFEQDARLQAAVQELADALDIPKPLHRIETYDISNVQGKHATGSMIVFTDGRPDKSQYRKFRIQSGDTPDDYRMMQEVLERRFSGNHEDWKMPGLILIDGGKGQLSAARKTLTKLKVLAPVAAIAKQEEELFVPGGAESIKLSYDSDALFLVQRMRDEAHRFVITYHRLLRSKQSSKSLLDEIPGIGPKLKKKLLNHFGSLKSIRAASDGELTKVIGEAKAGTLRDYL